MLYLTDLQEIINTEIMENFRRGTRTTVNRLQFSAHIDILGVGVGKSSYKFDNRLLVKLEASHLIKAI